MTTSPATKDAVVKMLGDVTGKPGVMEGTALSVRMKHANPDGSVSLSLVVSGHAGALFEIPMCLRPWETYELPGVASRWPFSIGDA
jgi:hypothetical protein